MSDLIGSTVLVFDADAWNANGGDDDNHNRQFWKPAVITATEVLRGDLCATVEWADGRTSRGHFVDSMRPVAELSA